MTTIYIWRSCCECVNVGWLAGWLSDVCMSDCLSLSFWFTLNICVVCRLKPRYGLFNFFLFYNIQQSTWMFRVVLCSTHTLNEQFDVVLVVGFTICRSTHRARSKKIIQIVSYFVCPLITRNTNTLNFTTGKCSKQILRFLSFVWNWIEWRLQKQQKKISIYFFLCLLFSDLTRNDSLVFICGCLCSTEFMFDIWCCSTLIAQYDRSFFLFDKIQVYSVCNRNNI